ncbi:hypothetical protein G5714_022177 [Onychostoma macrolepis]|uniref:C-type lectin domain-containing protein n=1 Tax=Onychostoma macrolepis TaxID=369639 RepID=A0A7J6BMG4_9TELE|nr:hypothetical protein G5714_022177 [Onychostoma macrolepis]
MQLAVCKNPPSLDTVAMSNNANAMSFLICDLLHSSDKLVLIRENKTWPEALRYCRERDMDLVSVDSEQMQRWVKILFMKANASSAHVWLGLRHSRILELWFWVSGHTMCYN